MILIDGQTHGQRISEIIVTFSSLQSIMCVGNVNYLHSNKIMI